jgi:polyphosphate glucokinase
MKILVVDVGGTHVKILATGQKQKREFVSGPKMTALRMVADVKKLAKDWAYDVVSIGFPGPVLHGRPVAEPHNLGCGWTGFNFASAFGLPVTVAKDAAMQALGSYRGRKDAVPGIGPTRKAHTKITLATAASITTAKSVGESSSRM